MRRMGDNDSRGRGCGSGANRGSGKASRVVGVLQDGMYGVHFGKALLKPQFGMPLSGACLTDFIDGLRGVLSI